MLPLVHIGMAKAASTFLQREVFHTLDGVVYLGKHHVSEDLTKAGAAIVRRSSSDWRLKEFRQPFINALADAGRLKHQPIYSEEDLSTYRFLDPEMMAQRLSQIFGRYDVLLIIREPISWIRSKYLFRLQNLDSLAVLGFEEWFSTHIRNRRIGSDVAEIWFSNLVRVYKEISGGKVIILPYELLKTNRDMFAEVLSEAIDVSQTEILKAMDTPSDVKAHKRSISQSQREFFEIFKWIVWNQPNVAEKAILDFFEKREVYLEAKILHDMRQLSLDSSADQAVWANLFRRMGTKIPFDEKPAEPELTETDLAHLKRIYRSELELLKRDFGFDYSAFNLTV